METKTENWHRHGAFSVGLSVVAMLVLSSVVTVVASFFTVMSCIGTEGAGVAASSVRGRVCDVPAVGPWAYTAVTAVLVSALCAVMLVRSVRSVRGRLALVIAPSVAMTVVVAVLHLLPR